MKRMSAKGTGMSQSHWIGVAALVSVFALTGCMSSPTYGTGKTAGRQLAEDVTGLLSLGPRETEHIEYRPRPKLVTPADTSELPAPQTNVVTAGNGVWPESPEERRVRIRAEATENRDDSGFRTKVRHSGTDVALMDPMSREATRNQTVPLNPSASRAEFNRRLTVANQGSPEVRRYLSEPPLEFRAPADTAPVGDVGVDEDKKEREREAAARKKSNKTSWRDLVPWL